MPKIYPQQSVPVASSSSSSSLSTVLLTTIASVHSRLSFPIRTKQGIWMMLYLLWCGNFDAKLSRCRRCNHLAPPTKHKQRIKKITQQNKSRNVFRKGFRKKYHPSKKPHKLITLSHKHELINLTTQEQRRCSNLLKWPENHPHFRDC